MIGFTAITLLGRPGELVRPYLIATRERVPLSSQLAALMLERIYDLLAALLVFGFALSRVEASEVHAGPALGWVLETGGKVAAAVAVVSCLVLVLIRQYAEKMRRRMLDGLKVLPERMYPKAERLVNAFVQGVESTRSWRALAALAGYTVLEWALIAGTMLCLVRAFPALDFGLVDVLIFMGFVSFGAVVQIPGIGGGFQVVAVLVLTELFAHPAGGGRVGRHDAVGRHISDRSSPRSPAGLAGGLELDEAKRVRPGGRAVKCPFCGHMEDRVMDSRESKEGEAIRRRRQCLECERRFTTYERIDEVPYMVIKKDGRREKFDRQKVLTGLLKACEKRPVSMGRLSELVDEVEAMVTESPDREISTTEIGEFLMDRLRDLDKIAYVRFASVYRDFQDEQAFLNELKKLAPQKL